VELDNINLSVLPSACIEWLTALSKSNTTLVLSFAETILNPFADPAPIFKFLIPDELTVLTKSNANLGGILVEKVSGTEGVEVNANSTITVPFSPVFKSTPVISF
jgi:hypothetical protein